MRCAIMLITLAVLPAIGFSQTTWYVPDDFSTIQGAINATVSGDTVIVMAGTYVENIDFKGKAITLQSELGPDFTIIDGNSAGRVVSCQSGENADSVLEGFTITEGFIIGDGGGMFNSN
jgi:serine protease